MMKNKFLLYILCGVLAMFLFGIVFKLFQNEKVYHHSIGKVSQNYERLGDWGNYEITQVSKPFLKIENDNYLQWDAAIYYCISQRSYLKEDECYGQVRAAFFPLFPYFWKVTSPHPMFILVLNYLMFIVAVALLFLYLMPDSFRNNLSLYACLISLPTMIVHVIPYSESLFLMCTTIAVIGIIKRKYGLYFFGMMLMSMVRPATLFVLFAIIATEIYIYWRRKKSYPIGYNLVRKVIPFVFGYLAVFFIQFASSGSWFSFFDAIKHWPGGFQSVKQISDWSVEGFGLNVFAICAIAIPSIVLSLWLLFDLTKKRPTLLDFDKHVEASSLVVTSLFYMAGIFLFILISTGGNIHSFFRFTMCSPFFYILMIKLFSKIKIEKSRNSIFLFGVSVVLMIIFLYFVEYGGSRLNFSFFGMLMLVLSFTFLLLKRYFYQNLENALLFLIVLLNTIWNTYMLNIYLSNGWIFA